MSDLFPIETTVEFEDAYCFGMLDVIATFRVDVEQRPGHCWTIEKVEAKSQDRNKWERISAYHPLRSFFESYVNGCAKQVEEALAEAAKEAAEASRSDAGDQRAYRMAAE